MKFKIGIKLTILAGAFPLIVGLINYTSNYFDNLSDFNNLNLTPLSMVAHVGFTNLAFTGFFIMSTAYFELRKKSRWAWYMLAVAFFWVGLNDAYALMLNFLYGTKSFPIAFIPTSLGLVALVLTYEEIFLKNQKA